MNIDILLKSAASCHRWLSASDGKLFSEWLTHWQRSQMDVLSRSNDAPEMYRAQGRLEVISRILGLKQEVEHYQEAVRTGKVVKI